MKPTIVKAPKGFRSYHYPSTDERNRRFNGARFVREWARYVGSAHRHYQTGELVLCWSETGPHPTQRLALKAELEADPRNIGSVLRFLDKQKALLNGRIVQTWKDAA